MESKDDQSTHRIYVCGPLTSCGIEHNNIRIAIDAHVALLKTGFVPFTPHLSALAAMSHEIPEHMAINWCLEWLSRCTAVLVLPGWNTSVGCNLEVAFAREHDIPIYGSIGTLLVGLLGEK